MEDNVCGIVMPISSIDGCGESHWKDVYGIIEEAVKDAGFEANMVSRSDDVGVIQKRIIQNLYENPIVVCDISGKNPNVMFELGMRLAFDKPTIIVKDEETSYSFDTSSIEHIEYPRDLRFTEIVKFKTKLRDKIVNTLQKSKDDPNYTTFLKHFGEFKIAKIDTKEVSSDEIILDELKSLKSAIASMEHRRTPTSKAQSKYDVVVCARKCSLEALNAASNEIEQMPEVVMITKRRLPNNHYHLYINLTDDSNRSDFRDIVLELLPECTVNLKRT